MTNTRDASGELIRVNQYSGTGEVEARAEFITPYVSYWSGNTPVTTRDVTFQVSQSDNNVASIQISPGDSIRAMVDDTVTLHAIVTNADGSQLLDKSVMWSENNAAIELEALDQEAKVTSHLNSSTTVTASSEGFEDSAFIQFAHGLCTIFSVNDIHTELINQNPLYLKLFEFFQLYLCGGWKTPTQEYRVVYGDGTSTVGQVFRFL